MKSEVKLWGLQGMIRLGVAPTQTSGPCSGYASVNSKVTLRRLFAQFALGSALEVPWRHLGGVSNFRQEAKGSSKMADSAVNQNCSFDCKWQPPMEAAILKKPFQLIRVVILIANGGPLCSLPFSRQNCVQSRETNQISLRRLSGTTVNAAQV